MMGLIAGMVGGGMLRSVLAGPCAIFAAIMAGIVALVALCGCVRCYRCIASCKMRDCLCCKRFLRATGQDEYDDFELMMVVHKVSFDGLAQRKLAMSVRVTAGAHCVATDSNSNGIFQQPLHIMMEQGTEVVIIELLDKSRRALATLELDVTKDVLDTAHHYQDLCYNMTQKGGMFSKGVPNPKINLTLSIQSEADVEKSLLTGVNSAVEDLVAIQLRKAGLQGGQVTEVQMLKQACAGPLECFERLGKTQTYYVGIRGPPSSRRWTFGMWHDQKEFDAGVQPFIEVDMMRIQSIQADPSRHHVFALHYFDEHRMAKTLTFRRIDRARDVWVEILLRLKKCLDRDREEKKKNQKKTVTSLTSNAKTTFGAAMTMHPSGTESFGLASMTMSRWDGKK